MDVFSFINSRDIRDYLKQIEYRFNSLEVAWLIWQCRSMSYEDKKVAWQEVINTMTDCKVESRANVKGWDSLHSMLRQYISEMDSIIHDFYSKQKDCVFMYRFLCKGDMEWCENYQTVFASLDECKAALEAELSDCYEVLEYEIRKQSLLDVNEYCEVSFTADGQIIQVDCAPMVEEQADILRCSFEGMWFVFPTPFKTGDIVKENRGDYAVRWDCDGGFVLKGLSTWNASDEIRKNGDITDMNGYGYFVNPDGTVYQEVMYNYMNLEYYNGPYEKNERILKAISMNLKGEADLDFLLCVYRRILLENAADDIMLTNWFSREDVEKMGIHCNTDGRL